jgi:YidC/Oxa1 family membrane protein insertase
MLMSLNTTDEAQRKQSSTMNIVMSVVLLFMSIKFNAALVLYWVTGNIFQVIQSRVVLTILNRNDNTPMKVDSSK